MAFGFLEIFKLFKAFKTFGPGILQCWQALRHEHVSRYRAQCEPLRGST